MQGMIIEHQYLHSCISHKIVEDREEKAEIMKILIEVGNIMVVVEVGLKPGI